MSITCCRSMVFCGYSCFLHQYSNRHEIAEIVESGVKHHQPTTIKRHSTCNFEKIFYYEDIFRTVGPLTVWPLIVGPLTVRLMMVRPLTLWSLTVWPLTVGLMTVGPLTLWPLTVGPLALWPLNVRPLTSD